MVIEISGQHIKTGDALKTYVNNEIEHNVKKYFDKELSGHVDFVKEGNFLYNCNITITIGKIAIHSKGSANDIYASFDNALVKVKHQLRKYKSRFKNHHVEKPDKIDHLMATSYIVSPHHEEEEHNEHVPVIIAEKSSVIEHMTVSEAVMKMDLEQLPAVLFVNSKSGKINVVYYRADGNIAWIEPEK
jgi:ribosomal subunit interface protein